MDKLWVYCSFNSEIEINSSQVLLSKASALIADHDIELEVICFDNVNRIRKSILEGLSVFGVSRIYFWENDSFNMFHSKTYVIALQKLINEYSPKFLLFSATSFNKVIAAQLATALEIGLTADCIEYYLTDSNDIVQVRLTFDGNTFAHIISESFLKMSTALPAAKSSISHKTVSISTEVILIKDRLNSSGQQFFKKTNNPISAKTRGLNSYDVVLSGGMGLKTKENFDRLRLLAEKYNVGLAASRPAVEMGWADKCYLVGISGQCISPKLYIAFGISGALQHVEGMMQSAKIIFINKDKNAPLNNICHYAILEDANEIIKALLDQNNINLSALKTCFKAKSRNTVV